METKLIFIIPELLFMTIAQPGPTVNSKRKLHSLKTDMTPMVDLGFLLITFFMFMATLSEPAVARLIMPREGEAAPVAQSHALTFLLDNEPLYAYEGALEEALLQNRVVETYFDRSSGAGHFIQQKQGTAGEKLVVVIQPLSTALYKNVVAALNEMQINGVKKYAIVEPSAEERF